MSSLKDELDKWQDAINAKRRGQRMQADQNVCRALQYSDTMSCSYCGLACDTNDPLPPQCPLTGQPMRRSGGPKQ